MDYFLGDATIVAPNSRKWTWANLNLGWSDGGEVSVKLVAHNVVATGQPTITGGAQVGKTLTALAAGIVEPNGMPADPHVHLPVGAGGWFEPAKRTLRGRRRSSTYTLTADDVGDKFKVIVVSFTDARGNEEGPLPSAAYPPYRTVTATRSPCPAFHDWCATMTVGNDRG